MKLDAETLPEAPPDPNLVTLTRHSNFTIVSIHAEPANVLTRNLWGALAAALRIVEADETQLGIAFLSGLRKPIFSAGNDIQELYAPNTSAARYQDFWLTSNNFLINLYTSRLVTVAAIKGASPAGGCALSLCCDTRIMTSNAHMKSYIGLNEVALGIHVPKFWGELMRRTAAKASGAAIDRVLLNATLMPSEQALDMGLVDELVDDATALERRAVEVLDAATRKKSARVMAARHTTKLLGREAFVARWRAYLDGEATLGWKALADEGTVNMLKDVLASLKASKL
jgi:3,2-trans-enoyl-CoA isomerase